MTEPHVNIVMSLSLAEFDFLCRYLVLNISGAPPLTLLQKLHNARLTLLRPLIIDLGKDDYVTVQEAGQRDDRIPNEPVLDGGGAARPN